MPITTLPQEVCAPPLAPQPLCHTLVFAFAVVFPVVARVEKCDPAERHEFVGRENASCGHGRAIVHILIARTVRCPMFWMGRTRSRRNARL